MSGTSKNGLPPTAAKKPLRCVLLHAPGTTVPTTLLASLAKSVSDITSFTDAYPALAEVFALGGNAGVLLILVEPATLRDAAELTDAVRLHGPQTQMWWYSHAHPKRLVRIGPADSKPWAVQEPEPAAPAAPAPPAAGPRLASTVGPETPRLKPGGAAAFRPGAKPPKPANASPRIVVRPGGGVGVRRLRLVGEDAELRPEGSAATPGPAGAGPLAAGGSLLKSESGPPSDDEAPRTPLLTEEELRMLLSDDEPKATNGSGKERSGH